MAIRAKRNSRAWAIPARYVSGYLHPRPEAEVGVAVAVSPTE